MANLYIAHNIRFNTHVYQQIRDYAASREISINRAVNDLAAAGLQNSKEVNKMEKIQVQRSGERTLVFQGERAFGTDDQTINGPRNTRWTELTIYRTAAGKYVAAVCRRTQWQGEEDRYHAAVVDDPAEFEGALAEILPAHLMDELRERFEVVEEVE